MAGRSYAGAIAGGIRSRSRTSSAAGASSSSRRSYHRRRIIRFNTRRLIIFQRITSQNIHQSLELPLMVQRSTNQLVVAQQNNSPQTDPTTIQQDQNNLICDDGISLTQQETARRRNHLGNAVQQEIMSQTSQTNNTSVMLSYL